ncbi:Crp/Fnr family transcriptional regulator [Niallia sp. Krafla_26]|uniref:Crp/Fnr family transcriptional regulator n=1 Tax=Niallia sp. Krafla_26 TaxID=3064703 RepID=UPI003D168ECD
MNSILFNIMNKYTTLSEEEQQDIVKNILIEEYKKGTVLLRQGDFPSRCYFVLKGCIRQYSIDKKGKEVTSNFYIEEQAFGLFNDHKLEKPSEYTFICLEDSVLVVGDLKTEKDMYNKYNQLESMTRQMMKENLGKVQDEFAAFIATTPEERYKAILRKRPYLINRVPQHQLASFLGMTPESLSRIKKRVRMDGNQE